MDGMNVSQRHKEKTPPKLECNFDSNMLKYYAIFKSDGAFYMLLFFF